MIGKEKNLLGKEIKNQKQLHNTSQIAEWVEEQYEDLDIKNSKPRAKETADEEKPLPTLRK